MSDNRAVSNFTRRREMATLEAVRNVTGGFDIDAYHAMEQRDDRLIEEELLTGHLSSKFVYNIPGLGSGISVVGARQLAEEYGGIKLRLVGSIHKVGQMLTFKSYPSPGSPMSLQVSIIPELAEEMDWYEVVVEGHNIKTGNYTQAEKRELAKEKKRDGGWYERPNYPIIAQSKAKRNATLELIPQDVAIQWKAKILALGGGVELTDSVIDQKRNAVLQFAASKAIQVDRHAVEDLTLAQIGGLSDAAHTKDLDQFRAASYALGLVRDQQDERTTVALSSTAAPPKQQSEERKTTQAADPTKTKAKAPKSESKPAAENGEAKQQTERKPATREEVWGGVEVDQAAGKAAAEANAAARRAEEAAAASAEAERSAATGNAPDEEGARFEARVLDFKGDPHDRGAMIHDPVQYVRKLAAYVATLTPDLREQAIDWNGSYIEAAETISEEAAKLWAASLSAGEETATTGGDAQAAEGEKAPAGQQDNGNNLVVLLEGAKFAKLVDDCAADLDQQPDAALDDWLAANRAYWDTKKVPASTRTRIEDKFVARKKRGAAPEPSAEEVAANAQNARLLSWALTICQEIDKVATAEQCRDLEVTILDGASALGRMFAAVRDAGGDRFENIKRVFTAKAAEVGYQRQQ